MRTCKTERNGRARMPEHAFAALLRYGALHQIRLQHHVLKRDARQPQLVEQRLRQDPLGQLEGALAAASRDGVRVHMGAARGQVPDGKPVEVRAPLGEDAPQLLVVALGLRCLVRSYGVAVVHAATTPAGLQAGALHALPVVELHAPVKQQNGEDGLEGLGRGERPLDDVEPRHDGRRVAVPFVKVELEHVRDQMETQAVMRVALESAHGVPLHDQHLLFERQRLEIAVRTPSAVHALALALLPSLAGRLDIRGAQQAFVLVVVERAGADGDVFAGGADGFEAVLLPHEGAHDAVEGGQSGCVHVDAHARGREALAILCICGFGAVAALGKAAMGALGTPAGARVGPALGVRAHLAHEIRARIDAAARLAALASGQPRGEPGHALPLFRQSL